MNGYRIDSRAISILFKLMSFYTDDMEVYTPKYQRSHISHTIMGQYAHVTVSYLRAVRWFRIDIDQGLSNVVLIFALFIVPLVLLGFCCFA